MEAKRRTKYHKNSLFLVCLILALFLLKVFLYNNASDPLPSWNEGENKKAIIEFVNAVTNKSNPHYVAPQDRLATFDNDGTLWVEQPLYTQFIFAIDRIKETQALHPEWKTQTPFNLILSSDKAALSQLTLQNMLAILAATHSGMSVEDYQKAASTWLAKAINPHFKHLYKETVYQPMLEVIQYLQKNNFKVFIVSGGGQEFIRAYSYPTYYIDIDHIIGTLGEDNYEYQGNQSILMKMPKALLIDDGKGKPEAINIFTGRKPIIAFGNSDGDREMLEWTQSNSKPHLMLLVHHDDATREYAYGPKSKVGTFSDKLMQEANANHWNVISMKNDWKVIFPFDLHTDKKN